MLRAACKGSSNPMVRIVGRTHPGARGGQNQDSIGWDESRQLAFVADGMGGYASGEVASGLVKQTLLDTAGTQRLVDAVMSAHANIQAAAAARPEYAGMGSTIVALHIADRVGTVVWVGDSRAYLWRRGSLQPLTRDHSVIEILRDAENLSETAIRSHPLRHKIVQSLGNDAPEPAVADTPLRKGDWLLLCSDGLSGELRDDKIADELRAHPSLEGSADALINGALANGGRDNISVVLVEYTGRSKIMLGGRWSERTMLWLSILGGVLLALTVTGVGLWFRHRR
jgi:serine/threonine protein phosphatase PrpC